MASILDPHPDNKPDAPDDGCPWCLGETDGQWMDLCDDHLRKWLRPALDRNDHLRRGGR